MALTPTDLALAGYHLFLASVIVARGFLTAGHAWVLVACGLFGALLLAIRMNRRPSRLGRLVHVFYPLVLFAGMYSALGVLNAALPPGQIDGNEALVQGWESALFGGQPSYDLIRRYPSVSLSGLLHLAYFAYYPTILLPSPVLAARGDWLGAQRVIGATITAFVLCYTVFALFPVAGPNWVFDHPTGPVREVWSARLVYGILGLGSSVGTAFPSSHVAATFATVIAAFRVRRRLGWITLVPFLLLTVSVVYCQMHYVVDAVAGLAVGAAAGAVAGSGWQLWLRRSEVVERLSG
jgi:membrane-associated phospholipid phosphatase